MFFDVKPKGGIYEELPAQETRFWNRFKFKQIIKNDGLLMGAFRYAKLYFAICVNHCFVYLVMKGLTLLERIFWLILILVSTYLCGSIAMQSITRFMNKNSYIGIERNYFDFNTTLPSLTTCTLERLDKNKFNDYCQLNAIADKQKDEFWLFLENLANSTYFNFQNIQDFPSTDATLDKLNLRPNRYMELIYNLTGDATMDPDNRIHCIHDEKNIHSRQILSEYGLCYMTSNLLDNRYTSRYFIFGELPSDNIYEEEHGVLLAKAGQFYEPYVEYSFLGWLPAYDIYVHSQYDVMKVDNNFGRTLENLEIEVSSTEIVVDDNFETDANVRQRNCRFHHESNLTHYPVYTKNLCLQECRINLVYKTCGCIPHFYPNKISKPKPVCNYKVLKECFPQHEAYFLKLYRPNAHDETKNDFYPCHCEQNCQSSVIGMRWSYDGNTESFYSGKAVKMVVKEWPTIRYKRQTIFTYTDLLVYIGGTAGLFMGFSVLGAIESIYFITMRLIFHLLGHRIQVD